MRRNAVCLVVKGLRVYERKRMFLHSVLVNAVRLKTVYANVWIVRMRLACVSATPTVQSVKKKTVAATTTANNTKYKY